MVDDYLPVMFSPPRDGKQMSEPVPVVGCSLGGIPHIRQEEEVEEMNGDNGDCSSNPTSKHDDNDDDDKDDEC